MSWQSYERNLPDYVRFTQTWGNKPGLGSYWKRQMQKARRRYWREMIQRRFWREIGVNWSEWVWCGEDRQAPPEAHWPHPRRGLRYESMVSMRTW